MAGADISWIEKELRQIERATPRNGGSESRNGRGSFWNGTGAGSGSAKMAGRIHGRGDIPSGADLRREDDGSDLELVGRLSSSLRGRQPYPFCGPARNSFSVLRNGESNRSTRGW